MPPAPIRSVALLLCLLGLSPSAFGAGAEIELLGAPPSVGEPIELRIHDQWATSCTPELSSVEVRGLDVWVFAREPSRNRACAGGQSSYTLETRLTPQGYAALERAGLHRVHFAVLANTGTRLRGFALIPIGIDSAFAEAPESGYWWADPDAPQEFAGPGIGLNLERQGATLSAVLFGYDFEGRPEWTLASGPMGVRHSRLSLSRLANGSGPRAAYQRPREVESIGSLWLEAHSPGRATVWLSYLDAEGGDLDLRRLEIARFSFSNSTAESWRGRWLLVQPTESGELRAMELSLSELRSMREGFALASSDAATVLLCVSADGGSEGLPHQCQLVLDDQSVPIEFDRFGLRQLQGIDAQGRPVRLMSLDNN